MLVQGWWLDYPFSLGRAKPLMGGIVKSIIILQFKLAILNN
jgi:hypothetical protein